jgi:trypsin-like peptidase
VHLCKECGWLLTILFGLPLVTPQPSLACVDATAFRHSILSVTIHFTDVERKTEPKFLGVRGTAWFVSATALVTAAHVAESMKLSHENWHQADIGDEDNQQSGSLRIRQFVGIGKEKIAILELQNAFPDARPLPIRAEPLASSEPVASLGYPGNKMRFAIGRFVELGVGDKFGGAALFEMYDGDDRLVLDHGASGAPIVDCDGKVVAVVSNIFTKTISFMAQTLRVSTAWGSPNIAAIPISAMQGAVITK